MDSPPRLEQGGLATVIEPIIEPGLTNERIPLKVRSASALIALCAFGIAPSAFIGAPSALAAETSTNLESTPPSLDYLSELDPSIHRPIPAEPANGLELASSLGDIFDTIGHQVIVDVAAIQESLGPDEALAITQTDLSLGAVEYPQAMVVMPEFVSSAELSAEGWYYATESAMELAAKYPNPAYSDTSGNIRDFASINVTDGWETLGEGINPHTLELRLNVERYVLSDGKYELLSTETTTAKPANNLLCDDQPRNISTISTEAVLTPKQRQTVCDTLGEYAPLVPRGLQVQLDAIGRIYDSKDSVLSYQKTMVLTYPYIGDVEVDENDFKQAALHELTHFAYDSADPSSTEIENLSVAYEEMVRATGLTDQGVVDDSAWKCLTEYNYWGGNSIAGHPQSNPSELLSSTASVIAYFPNEFLYEYNQLNPVAQKAVRNAVIATSNFYEANGINPTKVMPDIDNLLEIIVPAEKKDPPGPTKHFPLNDNPATPLSSNEQRRMPWRGKELAEK